MCGRKAADPESRLKLVETNAHAMHLCTHRAQATAALAIGRDSMLLHCCERESDTEREREAPFSRRPPSAGCEALTRAAPSPAGCAAPRPSASSTAALVRVRVRVS